MHSLGAAWYYHATYIAFSYFELFTDYEDDIFKVISLHIQLDMWGSKFDRNINKKNWKSLKVDLVVNYGMKKILYKTLGILTK